MAALIRQTEADLALKSFSVSHGISEMPFNEKIFCFLRCFKKLLQLHNFFSDFQYGRSVLIEKTF